MTAAIRCPQCGRVACGCTSPPGSIPIPVGSAATSDGYEYGVWHVRQQAGEEPHRTGMTRDEAYAWIREWTEMDGKPGVFTIVKRPLGGWVVA